MLDGGGAHWPKRQRINQLTAASAHLKKSRRLKTFKFEVKLKAIDFELGAIGHLLRTASSPLLRSLWSSWLGGPSCPDSAPRLAEFNPERFMESFSVVGRGRTEDEQKWLMVYLWLALLLLVLWLLLF